jgi:hypothetical protein
MSYLLFDGAYLRTLVEVGYADASARIDELEAFLRETPAPPGAARRGRMPDAQAPSRVRGAQPRRSEDHGQRAQRADREIR